MAAGGNVRIGAVGAGADSDLTIRGSKVTAGRNVNLLADDEISLLAAQNLADLHSANKSSGGSIGGSIGTGSGVAITASGSKGQGKAEGNDAAFTNTHITANETATLATLAGAVIATTDKAVADGKNAFATASSTTSDIGKISEKPASRTLNLKTTAERDLSFAILFI